MKEIVYLNGEFMDRDKAVISPYDHGFLYGCGACEPMRTYNGRFFRLSGHLDRMFNSLKLLGIDASVTPSHLEAALYRLLDLNDLVQARVRITVSAGAAEATPEPIPTRPTELIPARCFARSPEEPYRRGYSAMTTSIVANPLSPLCQIKSCNYLNFLMARREAHTHGVQEAMFLNGRGHLVEGSATNLFLVQDGKLITPNLASGALPGITRAAVLELAWESGISLAEKALDIPQLLKAQEAFLTSSIIEVMPLVSVNGLPIGNGAPGKVTNLMMTAYRQLVQQETAPTPQRESE